MLGLKVKEDLTIIIDLVSDFIKNGFFMCYYYSYKINIELVWDVKDVWNK